MLRLLGVSQKLEITDTETCTRSIQKLSFVQIWKQWNVNFMQNCCPAKGWNFKFTSWWYVCYKFQALWWRNWCIRKNSHTHLDAQNLF
jgi:hypothetical protein